MRIVVWNCNMALHKKTSALARIRPDIAILPEAALNFKDSPTAVRNYEWIGNNPHKGLGVMAFGPIQLELACVPDRNLEWVLPLRIKGEIDFVLLAVWAMNHRASDQATGPKRDRQVLGALESYSSLFEEVPVVVAGDFNDNTIWDKPNDSLSFAKTINMLQHLGLESSYREIMGERFGEEKIPTIYWRDRKIDGPRFHIDYCFLPRSWMQYASVTVGGFDDWIAAKHSDHVPLIVDLKIPVQ